MKIKTKKGKKYLFCRTKNCEISFYDCNGCEYKEYKIEEEKSITVPTTTGTSTPEITASIVDTNTLVSSSKKSKSISPSKKYMEWGEQALLSEIYMWRNSGSERWSGYASLNN